MTRRQLKSEGTLKLGPIPDRTPIKHSILLPPDINRHLQAYAKLHAELHQIAKPEKLEDLIPLMLAQFLACDRVFQSQQRSNSVRPNKDLP